jgi:two-component system OmpR family response regulator
MKILVVDDDLTHSKYVTEGLRESGHTTDYAKDGLEGIFMATENKYDVIILDRMMPKIDGISVLQTLRSSDNITPILILSSLSKTEDKVEGLRTGADDYLTKPFSFAELLARVEVLGKRKDSKQFEQTSLKFADLELNLLTRKVMRGGKTISLQNREFRLLEFLMRRPGQVVTRTMILEGVWDFHFDPQTNLIDAQISKLRSKVDKGFEKQLLHTIKGAGYKIDV